MPVILRLENYDRWMLGAPGEASAQVQRAMTNSSLIELQSRGPLI
jgi:hypothetical protein